MNSNPESSPEFHKVLLDHLNSLLKPLNLKVFRIDEDLAPKAIFEIRKIKPALFSLVARAIASYTNEVNLFFTGPVSKTTKEYIQEAVNSCPGIVISKPSPSKGFTLDQIALISDIKRTLLDEHAISKDWLVKYKLERGVLVISIFGRIDKLSQDTFLLANVFEDLEKQCFLVEYHDSTYSLQKTLIENALRSCTSLPIYQI